MVYPFVFDLLAGFDGSGAPGSLEPCCVRKLGTSNSRMTEWWTNRSMAAAVVIGFLSLINHSIRKILMNCLSKSTRY
jgi:hypothetical protein